MDVITIESKAYHEVMGKIGKILRFVEKEEKAKREYENRLVANDELAGILGISKRTLQRMRSADRISYKMIYGRCYYDLHDIEEAIRNRNLYCNPQNLKELRHNFKLKSGGLRMELLDRETFLEWMERIMKRFDDLKRTTPDIPQRPMINGEPLLDNQEVCLMLKISKRTLQRYRASGTLPFHIVYHKTWYLESEILAFMKAHFTENLKRKRERHPRDT